MITLALTVAQSIEPRNWFKYVGDPIQIRTKTRGGLLHWYIMDTGQLFEIEDNLLVLPDSPVHIIDDEDKQFLLKNKEVFRGAEDG